MMRAPRLVVVALGLLAVGQPAAAQNPSTALGAGEATERFSKTSHLDQNGTFDLTNVNGNVVITGSAGRDVTIEAIKRVQRPNPNAARALLQMIDIQVIEQANRVEVRTVVPRPRNFPGLVDYAVSVPEDATVTVKTITGNVRASNIRGALRADAVAGSVAVSGAGSLEAVKCVTGDIDIVDAAAEGLVSASTVSGNIAVRGLKARAIQLGSISGSIRVDDAQADRMMMRTVQGNLDYAGDVTRNGRYEMNSHSGDIHVALTGLTGFELVANTFSGSVRSDFAISRGRRGAEGQAPVQGARVLRGAFGDASAMLVLRAFSGTISITHR